MTTSMRPVSAVARAAVAVRSPDRVARTYFWSRDVVGRYFRVVMAIFTGSWLGILSRSQLEYVDERSYAGESKWHNGISYLSTAHNRQGMFDWESRALERYFPADGRLALLGAGAGREVLALRQRGYEVDAWECQPEFVSFANELLRSDGFEPAVSVVPRDVVPASTPRFDGVIVGWGTYTLVPGRHRRVALLKSLRAKVEPGAPILLSFYVQGPGEATFRITTFVGNVWRRLLRREPVELGDYLDPNFVHMFTEAQVAVELTEGGFELQSFAAKPYGHAIGRAVERDPEV
jgi:hypothetical protein